MIPPVLPLLTALAGVSLAAHLRAEHRGPRWQIYLFKPLTTGLLLAVAMLAAGSVEPRYQAAVAIGIAFSLVGDVLLILPGRFLPGLASFLLAHVAYLVALTTGVAFGGAPGLAVPLGIYVAVLLRYLWPGLAAVGRAVRPAVVLYAVVLAAMTWQALSRARALETPGSALAAAGALLFLVSDSALAIRRFRGSFQHDQAMVMLTYVAAQACIAWSVALR